MKKRTAGLDVVADLAFQAHAEGGGALFVLFWVGMLWVGGWV